MSLQDEILRRKGAMVNAVLAFESPYATYNEHRAALDIRSFGVRFSLRARKTGPHIPDAQVAAKVKSTWKTITARRMSEVRTEYQEQFTVASGVDIDRYTSLNQGEEGACSFVAFITLSKLNGKVLKNKRGRDKPVSTGWSKTWNDIQKRVTLKEGTTDIAETLDLLPSKYDLNGLVYLPIRSRGNSERNTHPLFTYEPLGNDLHAVDVILNSAALLEGLIDMGCPVEINFHMHSRVMVGYDEEWVLFADTWGDTHFEQRKNRRGDPIDVYEGGFSKVRKWDVYSFCRDICFFRPTGGEQASCPQAVGGEEKQPDVIIVPKLPKNKRDFKKYGLTRVGQQYKSERGKKIHTLTEENLRAMFKQFATF